MKRLALATLLLLATGCSAGPGEVVWSGPPSTNEIAITFDAHYDVAFTRGILDALAAAGVPATFFVTGQWAEAHPDWLQRHGRGRTPRRHALLRPPGFTKISDARSSTS